MDMYSDLGRYIQYYATLKKAWDDLEKYLAQRCPRMIGSLKGTVYMNVNILDNLVGACIFVSDT